MPLPDVVSVLHLGGHRLRVRFDDGVEGDVDLSAIVDFRGVFAPLTDPAFVGRAFVAPDVGTVTWPNGADLDPLVLYARVTGRAVETLLTRSDAAVG